MDDDPDAGPRLLIANDDPLVSENAPRRVSSAEKSQPDPQALLREADRALDEARARFVGEPRQENAERGARLELLVAPFEEAGVNSSRVQVAPWGKCWRNDWRNGRMSQ